jgi:hypothetical protein
MRRRLLALIALLFTTTVFAQKPEKPVVIKPDTSLPVTTTGSTKIIIQYVNPLRFQYNVQTTSTNVAGPTPPASLAPAASTAANLPPAAPQVAPPASSLADQWTTTGTDINKARRSMFALQRQVELATANAGAEQACYKIRLQYFSTWRLDQKHKDDLIAFATANGTPVEATDAPTLGDPTKACAIKGDDRWPFDEYKTAENDLYKVQTDLLNMTFDPGFAAWYVNGVKSAYDAATSATATISTQLQTFAVGGTIANSFVATVSYNAGERTLLAPIAAAATKNDDSLFQYAITVNCSNNWYGRGRTDVINLHYLDLNAATPTDAAIQVSASSCLTPGTVSTGIGMSFLHNTEYNFVSGIDPKNPGNTISVIGTTADQSVTPIYQVQYNIGIWDWRNGVGMQAAVGAGLGSSSGTATVEPTAGLSLSIMHRAFFVSPVLQIGRRQSLLPGYSIGFPAGNGLTAIPTQTNWKPGFALVFTFAVAQ